MKFKKRIFQKVKADRSGGLEFNKSRVEKKVENCSLCIFSSATPLINLPELSDASQKSRCVEKLRNSTLPEI